MSEVKQAASSGASEEAFPVHSSGYTLVAELGVGATCKVYRAIAQLTNGSTQEVAVKVMDLSQAEDWDTLFKEVALMRSMRHENIVHIITCFNEKNQLWIVMPLLGGGSMRVIMQSLCPAGFTSEPIIAAVLQGALSGLAYMHKNNYIHRDVKAGNILLSSTGIPQLADFGVAATTTNDTSKKAHTFTGTPCWMAPEVISQDQAGYGPSADIWSLGITALELAFGYPPYASLLPLKAMMETLDGEPPTPETYGDISRSKELSKEFRKFVERALQKDPSQRATALDLLQDPFIKNAAPRQTLVDAIVSKLPTSHLQTQSGAIVPLDKPVFPQDLQGRDPDGTEATTEDASAVPCSRFHFDDDDDAIPRKKASAKTFESASEAAAAAAASILAEDVAEDEDGEAAENHKVESQSENNVDKNISPQNATGATSAPERSNNASALQTMPLPPTPNFGSPTGQQQSAAPSSSEAGLAQSPEDAQPELTPEEQQRQMQEQWNGLSEEARQQLAPLVAKVQAVEAASQVAATEEEYVALFNERQALAAYLQATLQTRAAERQAVAAALQAHESQQQANGGQTSGPSTDVVEHCRIVLLRVQQELLQLRNTLYGSLDNDVLALLSNRMGELRQLQDQYMGFFELLQQQQQQPQEPQQAQE